MRISDAWRASTPAPLQKAIEHVRETFDDDLWSATQSADGCHQEITQANRTSPEPEIFQRHWNSLAKSIHQLVEGTFTFLLVIASQNNLENPIEWATSQVRLMLEDEMLVEDIQVCPRGATRLRRWIVTACDGGDQGSPPSTDKTAFERWLFYRDWQSPAWLHMKPLGNTPYNSDSAWIRDGVDVSQGTLAYHSECMWLVIWERLQKLAGSAHTRVALRGVVSKVELREPAVQQKGQKIERAPVARPDDDLEAKASLATKPLPRPSAYLSDLMDDAKLTEKQRVCYSLKWEHQLNEADIARRLGISRTAVYDRIAAAQKRMDQASANQKARKSAARRPQE
jgi:hypothetical protein